MSHEITLKKAMNRAFQAECILYVLANNANEINQVVREGLTEAALDLCGSAAVWLSDEEAERRGNDV